MNRTQLSLILGLIMALITTGLLILAGRGESDRMARAARSQQAQAIEVGAALYEAHCRSCHGLNGEGVGQMGPPLNEAHFFTGRLAEIGWPGSLADYISAVTAQGRVTATRPLYAGDGKAVMSAWAEAYGGPLRPDQIRALTAFALNWQPTALGEVTLAPLTLPASDQSTAIANGQQLFLQSGCAGCHTVAGLSAGQSGPNLTHLSREAAARRPGMSAEAYVRESFFTPNAYLSPGYEAAESPCGGALSQTQLDSLVAFLLSLE